jgi:selenocysteine-specific elongation factor
MKNIIIGTAGHIDHGKTTLVKALTGRETDTLEEEKRRGISINLGFTYFDLPSGKRAGIVDVPGHEKFIKNMLAGASGIDIVLLVIAADEGVMPQTVEHMDILSFLNIKNGIIVLTKSDLVDDDFKELVKEDIKERVKSTFLENAKIIEVDSVSKNGIDTLINEVEKLSESIEGKNESAPARLNIDRIFSVKGFGTVITGTLIEGKIDIDDDLVIYPKNIKTKIRSIQVHGKSVKTAFAGQRTAINISNVKVEEIERGDILAAQNSMQESMMLDVKLTLVKHSKRKLEHWDRLRVYHGTREILCRAVPLDKEALDPGETGYVQLRLEEGIVAKKGDMFVVRYYSPLETIGGGLILDPNPRKHKRFDENTISSLQMKEKGELSEIIEEYVQKNSRNYPNLKDIMTYTGENEQDIKTSLQKLCNTQTLILISNMYMHKTHYENLKKNTVNLLQDYHDKYPLRKGILKEEVRSKIENKFKSKDFDILLGMFESDNIIKLKENIVSIYNFEIIFTDLQQKIKKELESKLIQSGFTPPSVLDITKGDIKYKDVLDVLIGDSIIKLDEDTVISKQYYDKAKDMVINYIKENGEMTLAEFRDISGSSRKYSMIILEDFDKNKITKRVENKRVLY